MNYMRNLAIITAINDANMTETQAAQHFGISTRWIRTLQRHWEKQAPEALTPQPRALQ